MPENADITKGTQLLTTPSTSFSLIGNGSYIAYKDIDLTDVKQIDVLAQATPQSGSVGGILEIRLDAPDGKLLGQSDTVQVKAMNFARLLENAGGNKAKPAGKPEAKPAAKPAAAPAAGKKPAAGGFDMSKFDFNMLRRMMATHNTINLPPTEGKHTIYIVGRNQTGGDDKVLMQLVEVQFRNVAMPPPPPMPK